jgi:hypothetical protein
MKHPPHPTTTQKTKKIRNTHPILPQHRKLRRSGADPGFQVRGTHLKKLRRAEGGAKIFEVFRVKNHDLTPKNFIFSNFRGGARRVRAPPPWIRPWGLLFCVRTILKVNLLCGRFQGHLTKYIDGQINMITFYHINIGLFNVTFYDRRGPLWMLTVWYIDWLLFNVIWVIIQLYWWERVYTM